MKPALEAVLKEEKNSPSEILIVIFNTWTGYQVVVALFLFRKYIQRITPEIINRNEISSA